MVLEQFDTQLKLCKEVGSGKSSWLRVSELRLPVDHVRNHAGAVRSDGLHGLHRVWLQQRPGVLVRTLLLVPQLVVVSAEPPPAEPARVRLLT